MQKPAAPVLVAVLLSLVVGIADRAAARPNEKIAFDSCYMDYWFTGGVVCSIVVMDTEGSVPLVVPGGIEPRWARDGSRIAFTGTDPNGYLSEIFVVNLDTGVLTNLTNPPAANQRPSWAPDGSKIAFESDRDGLMELYVVNADGSGVTRLTDNVGFDGRPAWSPDGARIAFDCRLHIGASDICVINANGTGFTRLTSDPSGSFGAAWSPDGTRIAFATARFDGTYPEIAIMNADGTGASPVGPGPAGALPAWSPDGSRIAFLWMGPPYGKACNDVCNSDIWIMNVDGTGLQWFSQGSNPAWMP